MTMGLQILSLDALSEIEGALRPVLEKLKRERGIHGTSVPLPGMGRRIKVKGAPIDFVRQHEAVTDARIEAINSALLHISVCRGAAEDVAA